LPTPIAPDLDRIIGAVHNEVADRGARTGIGARAIGMPPAAAPAASPGGLPKPAARHVADLLTLPLDVFIADAYQAFLGRAPDAEGANHYQRALLRGRLTRIEVLGRLAYSGEGRRHARSLPGLAPAFLLATAYRIPVLGPVLAIAARLLRLPAHWQDRSTVEAAGLASGDWMRR
jgi:hypothetical protein